VVLQAGGLGLNHAHGINLDIPAGVADPRTD